MKLTFEQIKSLVHGAERKFEKDGVLWLLRFTEDQTEFYSFKKELYDKSAASAGIHLDFTTDSRTLKLELDTVRADLVDEFWHDIYIDGKHTFALSASLADAKDGRMLLTPTLMLPEGSKRITVYLPWTGCTRIRSLELEDGVTFEPVKHKLKMIMYGDSITHGSWASDTSSLYTTRLSHALDADGINKGLGGDVMRVGFTAIKGNISPDIVTIAYGTNDWSSKQSIEKIAEDSKKFYTDASASYPNAKIFVISPIWRGDLETKATRTGSFDALRDTLKRSTEGLANVVFINGYDLVPHSPEMFSPDLLHPSDLGFEHYAKNLLAAIKPYLG